MFLSITLIISGLIAINFLLLIFSCNKTTKKPVTQKTENIRVISPERISERSLRELAPTGS
jgi:hypothetical protein